MGARRRAREHALMMLYGMDVAGRWPDAAIEHFYDQFATGEPLDPPPSYEEEPTERDLYAVAVGDGESRKYSEALVRGVSIHQEELDALLQKISVHWRLERMALVDRNLLRLAAFELTKLAEDVPRNVAINEAIELAKVFGTPESGAFVNGILDRIGR